MENNYMKKVMSDEQIETLRMQIALYNYICDLLADNYCLTLQPPLPDFSFPEVKVENVHRKEPLMLHGGQRRRWTPTREQIQILESLFEEGDGSRPDKQKIKEITAVLSQHGEISETNVYTWFQNRRARKRKMHDHKNQNMMKMFQVDQLVSTSTYNNNNNNNNNNSNQVEFMSWVNNYVPF